MISLRVFGSAALFGKATGKRSSETHPVDRWTHEEASEGGSEEDEDLYFEDLVRTCRMSYMCICVYVSKGQCVCVYVSKGGGGGGGLRDHTCTSTCTLYIHVQSCRYTALLIYIHVHVHCVCSAYPSYEVMYMHIIIHDYTACTVTVCDYVCTQI